VVPSRVSGGASGTLTGTAGVGRQADEETGKVSFDMELTTPACPIKDQFEKEVRQPRVRLHHPPPSRALESSRSRGIGKA
jgi:hypothetical protein